MANVKITELTAATALAGTDVLPIVDVGADATKKVSVSDLLRNLPDGSAASPSLAFADDQNSGILSPANNELAFATSGTQRLVIDSSGRVGIGTSTLSNVLHVHQTDATANSYVHITQADGGSGATDGLSIGIEDGGVNAVIRNRENGYLRMYTNNSERMRIDSSGNFGIGTTAPNRVLEIKNAAPIIRLTESAGTYSEISGSTSVLSLRADEGAGVSNTRIDFRVDGSEKMRIDSSGRVGIGASSPSQLLHLNGTNPFIYVEADSTTGNSGITFADGANKGQIMYDHDGDYMRFSTNGSSNERMRIDNTGRVLIGSGAVSTPKANTGGIDVSTHNIAIVFGGSSLSGTNTLRENNVNKDGRIAAAHYSNTEEPVGVVRASSTSTTNVLHWGGGSSIINAATDHRFYTASNTTTAGGTERMRINSSGRIGMGTSSPTSDAGTTMYRNASGNFVLNILNDHASGYGISVGSDSNNIAYFYSSAARTAVVGTISKSASSTSYNTSSDYRLKENVVDLADGITRVKQLQPRRFNFIVDADTTVDGFVAHEAQTVVPEAVTGTHNEVDDDGNAVMQGIDQSKLVPLLTAALQEAIAKIETLETKVAALEAQ